MNGISEITKLIEGRQNAVLLLLHKYSIFGDANAENVLAAYRTHGDNFLQDFDAIVKYTPQTEFSNFAISDLWNKKTPNTGVTTTAPSGTTTPPKAKLKDLFTKATTWVKDNKEFLKTAAETAGTFINSKNAASQQSPVSDAGNSMSVTAGSPAPATETKNPNMVYYIGGGIVAVLIIVLLILKFKK
jgi:hypothetical protein